MSFILSISNEISAAKTHYRSRIRIAIVCEIALQIILERFEIKAVILCVSKKIYVN